MLVDRWDVWWMQPAIGAMVVGADDGRLAACDVAVCRSTERLTIMEVLCKIRRKITASLLGLVVEVFVGNVVAHPLLFPLPAPSHSSFACDMLGRWSVGGTCCGFDLVRWWVLTMVDWLHMTWRRTSDGADDQHVRIRTSSTASTWFGRWKC